VQLSDHRVAEAKLILDDVFSRDNFINQVTVKTRSPSGFKTVNLGVFESAEYIMLHGRKKSEVVYRKQYERSGYDTNYASVIDDLSKPCEEWRILGIKEAARDAIGEARFDALTKEFGSSAVEWLIEEFAQNNADRVFRLTTINDDA